jgi:hypothetical protein
MLVETICLAKELVTFNIDHVVKDAERDLIAVLVEVAACLFDEIDDHVVVDDFLELTQDGLNAITLASGHVFTLCLAPLVDFLVGETMGVKEDLTNTRTLTTISVHSDSLAEDHRHLPKTG